MATHTKKFALANVYHALYPNYKTPAAPLIS